MIRDRRKCLFQTWFQQIIPPVWGIANVTAYVKPQWRCPFCRKNIPTRYGMGMHLFRVHGTGVPI